MCLQYGRFFLGWYLRSLLQHGDDVMQAASSAFAGHAVQLSGTLKRVAWYFEEGHMVL